MNNIIKKEEIGIRRDAGIKSFRAFKDIYLASHFEVNSADAQLEIIDVLTNASVERGTKLAIVGPRGLGKSIIISSGYVVYSVCCGLEKFIVLVSHSSSQAIQMLENVKRELTENPLIREDFPELFEFDKKPKTYRLTRNEIETRNGIKIIALGADQSFRGRRYGRYRPDLILLDDFEKGNIVTSAEVLEKAKETFQKSILKMGDVKTNIIMTGTIFNQDCLMADCMKENNPGWKRLFYQAIVEDAKNTQPWDEWADIYNYRKEVNGQTGPDAARVFYLERKEQMDEGAIVLWPDKWTYYQLKMEYENDPLSFNSEFQNKPYDFSKAMFNVEIASYWGKIYASVEDLLRDIGDHVEFYGACDPSLGLDTTKGAYSAIIILARDTRTGVLYVIVSDIERRDVGKIQSDVLAYAQRYRFVRFVFETNLLRGETCKQLIEKSRQMGIYFPIVPQNTILNKIIRVQSIEPYVRNGTLQFMRDSGKLIEQLRYFPTGKYKDGPDCLAMAVEAASQGPGKVQVRIIERKDDWRGDYRRNLGWNL